MDTELYELCKEVYKRTGLGKTDIPVGIYLDENGEPYGFEWWGDEKVQPVCPLYTSDYLLEKLPQHIKLEKTNRYYAIYLKDGVANHAFGSDTPLKALLKLTIALDDAGELK